METYQVGLIALVIAGLISYSAYRVWTNRIKRQSAIFTKPQPASDIEVAESKPCFYVASTFAGRPLDRVFAHGLGNRGKAHVSFVQTAIVIHRTGELGFNIPAAAIVDVSENNAVIDRAVEKGGLSTISWKLGDQVIETHLRFIAKSERDSFISQAEALRGNSE